jgi:hypothetical protein
MNRQYFAGLSESGLLSWSSFSPPVSIALIFPERRWLALTSISFGDMSIAKWYKFFCWRRPISRAAIAACSELKSFLEMSSHS